MKRYYIAIEGRLNGGPLRKQYVSLASDTSRGGHLLSTRFPERSYPENQAREIMSSASSVWPEWGVKLEQC